MYKPYLTLFETVTLPFVILGITSQERFRIQNPNDSYYYPNAYTNAYYENGENVIHNNIKDYNAEDEDANVENVPGNSSTSFSPEKGIKQFD